MSTTMTDFRPRAARRYQLESGLATMTPDERADRGKAVGKLCRMVDGELRIVSDPPLLVPVHELLAGQMDRKAVEAQMSDLIGGYRRTLETDRRHLLEQFTYADMARKVAGVGSVGTRCWVVLMLGSSESDALFLQV